MEYVREATQHSVKEGNTKTENISDLSKVVEDVNERQRQIQIYVSHGLILAHQELT